MLILLLLQSHVTLYEFDTSKSTTASSSILSLVTLVPLLITEKFSVQLSLSADGILKDKGSSEGDPPQIHTQSS